MAAERVVIVGAGPAGLATARGYRGGAGAVTLIGEETVHPYERPPLTKGFLRRDREAGLAGLGLAGEDVRWESVPGFWSTIGEHTLKHAAWGDGHALARLVEHAGGAFTVWHADAEGTAVGVLTHECDADYERGRELIARREATP
jgi:Pyridine nucleotide-disulphide oxidoreductase